ncbi:hypothetical protein Q9L42_021100 (plasmid) [Methylomarinum sp. Ch1-1]|uniref:Uncharacterized protein n=1 Tax=Methylomarinum roseum TaxID=3067653 RepID=A0AAU7P0N8_9GAMM|nr:hypothetical protein [Methylomarinum sp. Ch1-1]MDP4523152.1 hypothetical protein [Methylomarinum sp. Ch1-1]
MNDKILSLTTALNPNQELKDYMDWLFIGMSESDIAIRLSVAIHVKNRGGSLSEISEAMSYSIDYLKNLTGRQKLTADQALSPKSGEDIYFDNDLDYFSRSTTQKMPRNGKQKPSREESPSYTPVSQPSEAYQSKPIQRTPENISASKTALSQARALL